VATTPIPNTDDLNDKKTTGVYGIAPSDATWESLHYPSNSWGILRVTQCTAGPGGVLQEIYGYGGNKYQRSFYDNQWYPWSRMDNFGCNTQSDLAELLGVGRVKYAIGSGSDVTTVTINTQNDNGGLSYYGSYLISFTSTGDCVLILAGYSSFIKVAELGGALDKLNITSSAGVLSITSKSATYPMFNVYRV
jgi:hypothetical protein